MCRIARGARSIATGAAAVTFAEHLAQQASEIAEARQRIGQQAADRAEQNGFDPEAARVFAVQLFKPNCCHETIIAVIAGEYRRRAA